MKVSVLMITYNQEDYISDAIKGVFNQITNFEFEIVISNDASTDNSDFKIRELQKTNYNENLSIKYLHRDLNLGMILNYSETFKQCKGKYIATCEGDDYWVDPYKLQKQVDFMEGNLDFNLCFTRSNYLQNKEFKLLDLPLNRDDGVFYLIDLYKYYNFITTSSSLFRKQQMPDFIKNLPYGDLGIYTVLAKDTKIKCLDFVSSVYRIHDKGVWQGSSRQKQIMMSLLFNKIIYPYVDATIKSVIKLKSIVIMEEIIKIKFNKNKLFRGVYYRFLKYKYFPK